MSHRPPPSDPDVIARLEAALRASEAGRETLEARRVELERELAEARKLEGLGVMAGGMAHEFNNLLTAILTNAELTRMDLPIGPMRESVDEIVVATRRAAELARQMLAYAGRGKFVITATDLSELVRGIRPRLAATLPSQITLEMELQEGLPAFEADATLVQEAISKLIVNAAEAIDRDAGTITLRTGSRRCDLADLERLDEGVRVEAAQPGRYVFVEVVDTGGGMDSATRERLFEPFFSTKFPGRGLGMSAVLGVVRSHRGAIDVRSEVGRGTVARLLFPADVGKTQQPAKPTDESRPSRGAGPILLVDDEEAILRTGKRLLDRIGFDVLCAPDGSTGLELFRENAGDLAAVMVDLTMPNMDGEAVVRAIRDTDERVPVFVCSGYGLEETSERFAGLHVNAFIQKPYTTATLLMHLRPLLEQQP